MKIKILSTSDVHGYLFPNDFRNADNDKPFGYLKAISIINAIREEQSADEIVLYIENGDFIEGSPLTDYLFRTSNQLHFNHKLNELVNHVHPDAAILGNHEFNYGIKYIHDTWKKRKFPILSANMSGKNLDQISDGPFKIIEHNGVKIAILGLTTQFIPKWEKSENLDGIKFHSAVETAKYWVPRLHKEADVVIVSYHGGFECDLNSGEPTEKLTGENEGSEILRDVPGIDALVTGHQHREIADVVNKIPVTQPGYRGANVGEITLDLDNKFTVIDQHANLIKTADYPIDVSTEKIVSGIEKQVNTWLDKPLAKVIGNMQVNNPMETRLHGDEYLDFINKIQMDATNADISSTSLFNDEITGLQNIVTIRNVLNSYIFPNTLVVEKITGKDLKLALEHCAEFFELNNNKIVISKKFVKPKLQLFNYDYYSGVDYTFDLNKPVGQRVVKLLYHDKPLLSDQKILLTLNQYRGMGAGDYDMFSTNKIVRSNPIDMPKLIMNYLEKEEIIKATKPNNLKVIF